MTGPGVGEFETEDQGDLNDDEEEDLAEALALSKQKDEKVEAELGKAPAFVAKDLWQSEVLSFFMIMPLSLYWDSWKVWLVWRLEMPDLLQNKI